MRTTGLKFAMLALVLVLAVSLTGCVKDKKALTLMPDGSGKLDFRLGFNAKLIEDTVGAMMPEGGEGGSMTDDDPTDLDLAEIQDRYQGFVAFTMPKVETSSDGWKYVTFTGYFDDINKVAIFDEGDEEDGDESGEEGEEHGGEGEHGAEAVESDDAAPTATFKFAKTETGYVLEVVTVLKEKDEDMGGQEEESNPEMEKMVFGMMAAMLKDLEFGWVVNMPGPVTEAAGFELAGRQATFVVKGADLANAEDMKKLAEDTLPSGFSFEVCAIAVPASASRAIRSQVPTIIFRSNFSILIFSAVG